MKIKVAVCLAVLLLLTAGCRSAAQHQPASGSAASPGVSSSAAALHPPDASQSLTANSQPTDSSVKQTPSSSSSPAPQAPSSPSTETAASKEDVNATLDDIIKELNDLDKLYSQMDNLNDTDLN